MRQKQITIPHHTADLLDHLFALSIIDKTKLSKGEIVAKALLLYAASVQQPTEQTYD